MTYTTNTHVLAPSGQNILGKLWEVFYVLQRRRAFNKLLDLDDHLLDDMGVTRAEVHMASRLPVWTNAADELRRVSLERRGRRM